MFSMGTNQQLTTKQIAVLMLAKDVEEFIDENCISFIEDKGKLNINIQEQIAYVIESMDKNTEDASILRGMDGDDVGEVFDVLKHYGYVDKDDTLTTDGKQYLLLFEEYLGVKIEQPQVIIHNEFSLISFDKLLGAINVDFAGIKLDLGLNIDMTPAFDFAKSIGKKIIEIIKNRKQDN